MTKAVLVEGDKAKRDELIKQAYDIGQVRDWAYVPLHQQAWPGVFPTRSRSCSAPTTRSCSTGSRSSNNVSGGKGCRRPGAAGRRSQRESANVMLAFIIRRAFQALLVMLVVALIAFTLFRFVGDPINQMVWHRDQRGGARRAA